MLEKTLVVVKPDGVQRSLAGKIIQRFEDAGLKIVGMKMVWIGKEFAKKHYTEDIEKRHGEKVRGMLVGYITRGPVVAIVLEGIEAVEAVRKITGSTYPSAAAPGTIRGDFAHMTKEHAITNDQDVQNLLHASGSKEEAKAEIALWFSEKELHSYKTVHEAHVFH
ncbi:MAG: nucleoside-diphosphate kinase [Candidatus Diapherotrites archaeon]|uniref:Nucleoside diphosphate kinase n=1 Tax=Candidatus Iainarchaeum sp. TaxID=3101447 RepID=A0A7J4JU25_9ARCH|nr:nucleoside-diphosphate kinase [Candidatus Diapherotrites archaeon]HIH21283.1 nucleoside-diphosphate kinase [Candidatus Diapherotrites archaeon]HIH33260.1 nucleoside-diphosphate kinase [Candidatus Diapherotrites archaeon]